MGTELVATCGKVGTLLEPNRIIKPQCESALQFSRDSVPSDVVMRPCGVAVQALSHWAGSETADGVLIKRNTTIPESVLHVIHVSCVANRIREFS